MIFYSSTVQQRDITYQFIQHGDNSLQLIQLRDNSQQLSNQEIILIN